jgi:hypothetical protein
VKLYNENNPRHRKILQEELKRASRLIREYDESKIWKEMPEMLRIAALHSFDKEKGEYAADDYAEQDDWKKIPAIVTNSINLRDFDTSKVDVGAFTAWLTQNKSRLPKGTWFEPGYGMNRNTDQLIDYLKGANPWPAMVAVRDAIGILMYNGFKVPLQKLQSSDVKLNDSPDFAPGVDPLAAIRRPGSNWTGD